MRYTHNYFPLYEKDTHGDEDFREFYTDMFKREAADALRGLREEDAGGIILYYDAQGREAAYFDYENLVGSIYSITGRRSDQI